MQINGTLNGKPQPTCRATTSMITRRHSGWYAQRRSRREDSAERRGLQARPGCNHRAAGDGNIV